MDDTSARDAVGKSTKQASTAKHRLRQTLFVHLDLHTFQGRR